ncbi:MAG: sulfotransferase, partial [Myxococcota bacterium]
LDACPIVPIEQVDSTVEPQEFPKVHRTSITPPVCVPVLGMHRSGTSMVTRLLNLLGVELGEGLLGVDTPAHPSNPTGHWESSLVVKINETAMRRAAALETPTEWTIPMRLGGRHVADDIQGGMDMVIARLAVHERFGFKDPRTTVALEAWWRHLPQPASLLVVRDPIAVARSLERRDGIPLLDGVRIWAAYNRIALASIESLSAPCLVVRYADAVMDVEKTLSRIACFLSCTGEALSNARDDARRFVNPDLNHGSLDPRPLPERLDDLGKAHWCTGERDAVVKLWEHLRHEARKSDPASSEHVSHTR